MPVEELKRKEERRLKTIEQVEREGWSHIKDWLFKSPSGSVHDLSAANLNCLGYIEANRLFLKEGAEI